MLEDQTDPLRAQGFGCGALKKHCHTCERVKKKKETFFFVQVTPRKINWWNSHGVFECYNHGELEYLKEDFATGFVVRLYLLLDRPRIY